MSVKHLCAPCSKVSSSKNTESAISNMLSDLITQKKLYKTWNVEFNVPEFDVDLVCDELEPLMSGRGGIILEFHSCDFFPERWFQLVVLLRCDNTYLYDRLKNRRYDEKKITENIECEILDVLKDEVE